MEQCKIPDKSTEQKINCTQNKDAGKHNGTICRTDSKDNSKDDSKNDRRNDSKNERRNDSKNDYKNANKNDSKDDSTNDSKDEHKNGSKYDCNDNQKNNQNNNINMKDMDLHTGMPDATWRDPNFVDLRDL